MLASSLAHKVVHVMKDAVQVPSHINITQDIIVLDKCSLKSFSLLAGDFQEKESIHTVMEENEKLLQEKRDLLQKISEAEEMGSKGMRMASTVQHRYHTLYTSYSAVM